jgi:hypothetical protein
MCHLKQAQKTGIYNYYSTEHDHRHLVFLKTAIFYHEFGCTTFLSSVGTLQQSTPHHITRRREHLNPFVNKL